MEVKQNGSFRLGLEVEIDGAVQDLTGWTIAAAVATKSKSFYQELTVIMIEPTLGQFEITGPTRSWPVGELLFDIKYVSDSDDVIYTETMPILVKASITK